MAKKLGPTLSWHGAKSPSRKSRTRCKASLPRPHTPCERLCSKCRGALVMHRMYMFFMVRNGWHCQSMEEDLKTHLPKRASFRDPAKIYEIARRVRTLNTREENTILITLSRWVAGAS